MDRGMARKRQDSDLSWVGNFIANAVQVASLVMSVLGDGGGGGSSGDPDRIGTSSVAASAAAGGDDLDVAMGTLMAYGGKYLRQMAVWAWEYGTQTPVEQIGASPSSPASSVASVSSSNAKPYLSTLQQSDLEKLGLKAVNAGANPVKLQQAFANAQINGDWSSLETEIASVLGPSAVSGGGSTSSISSVLGATGGGGPGGVLTQATQLMQSLLGGGGGATDKVDAQVQGGSTSSSEVPQGGLSYYTALANQYITKLQKVVEPPQLPPGTQQGSDATIANQNIVTRFITEFGLEQEALAVQSQVNKVILSVNSILEPAPATADDKIDKIGTAADTTTDQGSGGSWTDIFTAIPQAIGAAAVTAVKFISPKAPTANSNIQNKVDKPDQTFSTVKPLIDMNTVAFGMLGVGALGSVAYGLLAAGRKRRKRNSETQQDLQWIKLGQHILRGIVKHQEKLATCDVEWEKCIKLSHQPRWELNVSQKIQSRCNKLRRHCSRKHHKTVKEKKV